MHAVLTRLKAASGKLDEVKALAAALVMPAYVEHAALGAYILASSNQDELLVLVLYGTLAEAETVEAGEAMHSLLNDTQQLLACPPAREIFEVLAGTTGSAPGPPLNGDILAFLSDVSRAL